MGDLPEYVMGERTDRRLLAADLILAGAFRRGSIPCHGLRSAGLRLADDAPVKQRPLSGFVYGVSVEWDYEMRGTFFDHRHPSFTRIREREASCLEVLRSRRNR
ncbi:hypothetical protein SBBP2_480002 [Burkholderiales bacterium]|nr:hypothetical protein SBBP2_480002 [Burkholderiales bacterium]